MRMQALSLHAAFRIKTCVNRLLALLLCVAVLLGVMPAIALAEPNESNIVNGMNGQTLLAARGEVDHSAVCRLIPVEPSYASGESIQYILNAQYATPGEGNKPKTVKFGIPIPDTTPEVQLPMFYSTGSGEYAGVPMYPLSYNGMTVDLYLKTGSNGERWIEFTLDAGSTIQGTLSMVMPNGISEGVPAFTLTPEILSEGDYGTNTVLQGGTTAVTAEFGWHDVNKTANTDNIGVIGAATKDPDRITYSITADSQSSGLATGRIFTKNYLLKDTISFLGLNYADGALTQSESDGVSTFSVGGTPVLEIAAPLSSLYVTKQVEGGLISAFNIEYSVSNTSLGKTDGSAAELPNLNLSVDLLLSAMQLNSGTEDTLVTNTAKFDAYSPFGDHHESQDSHTAYTQDRYHLTKAAYMDEACTQPASLVEDGDFIYYKITATNNSSGNGPFKITDVLPNGLAYVNDDSGITASQSGQTLTWDGLAIPSGSSKTIVLKTEFNVADFTDMLTLHNVAHLYNDDRLLISASADCTFLTGEDNDSDISYGKTVNKVSANIDDELTYTITVKNRNRSVSKLVTVVDKWPGNAITPIEVTGCQSFKLLDAGGTEYTLEQVTADPSIIITHIKCYNVFVPAGGSTKLNIKGKIKEVLDELVNIVGEGTSGEVSAKTYGVRISKAAYAYDATAQSLGDRLTSVNPVDAGAIVCYEMTITNFKDADINILQLIDKLPANLSLQSVSFNGVTSSAVLRRGDVYSALAVTGETSTNHQTTEPFKISSGETVRVYLFANVSQQAIDDSVNTSQRILNAAYVKFNNVQTGDATVNIYTNADTERKLHMDKWFKFVADFDDELHYDGTWLQTPAGDDVFNDLEKKTTTVWNGAYIGYQLQIKNASAVGGKKIEIYEILDSLPPGTEFVGVAKNGNRAEFNNIVNNKRDLTGALIFDGETDAWKGGIHSSNVKCTYDQTANQVRIQFLDADNNSAPVLVAPSSDNSQKLFMLIVARVKDDSEFSSYVNTAEVKVDNDVEVNDANINGLRTVEEYNYISASCTANTIPMAPGITKQFIGHYFPSGTAVPQNVENTPSISPGESLRFTVQVKNQGLDNSKNAVNANLQDFTVTDILPAEYTYRASSTTIELNAGYNTTTGAATSDAVSVIERGIINPTQETLPDGRTKLTWTFSGEAMRLLSNKQSSKAGFMHLITYDTDWNKNYLPRYGNYTNTANVNHSYEFTAVSTGSPDYDEKSIAASAVVNVFGAAGTAAIKAVTNEANQTVTGSNETPYIPIANGETVTYTLTITNSTTTAQKSQTQSIVIIDELPRAIGDTGIVNRVNRGSQFTVLFGKNPEVSVYKSVNGIETQVNSADYTVRYGNHVGALNSNGDWSDSETGGKIDWGKDSTDKNAVRIAFAPDYSLASGESIIVHFSAYASGDADPGEIAWNSFGYSYRALIEEELSERIYAEPPRVGISVPGAMISVTKKVTGDKAPSATSFSFLLKQDGTVLPDVKYALSGDTEVHRTGSDGSFTLTAEQTATFYVTPGSNYSVEEADLPADFSLVGISAAAAGDGTYVAPDFTFKKLDSGSSVGAICTNDYVAPPMGQLTVSKTVTGGGDTNALFSFYFTFSGTARYDYVKYDPAVSTGTIANGESLKLKDGESVTITIPQNITYTVTEDAYSQYIPTPADRKFDGTISATPSTAAYTNSYDQPYVPPTPTLTGTLKIQKTVTGDLGDQNKEFAFQIVFDASGSYSFTGSKTGAITSGEIVMLKHGENITITGLPAGTTYSVTESGNSGYRVYASGEVGMIAANSVSVAAFTNSRSKVPSTGEDGALSTGIMLMLISLICGAGLMIAEQRLKRRR